MVREGEFTSVIYGHIRDQKYKDAISILNQHLLAHSSNRAALSLLGYCLYQLQDYVSASDCYEQLANLYPEVENYKLYFAKSLYKADLFQPAMKVAAQIEDPNYRDKVIKLQAAIRYKEEDFAGARSLIDECASTDVDSIINLGCLCFCEKNYQQACELFQQAQHVS
ncbi:unnamed protein product [Protopolystoma xenopodis]|uniref:Tetratricopeptide repeat protein 30 n=1 Tax=Protopolystoma xenopodis TaxID=117903 RepID=A0A448WTH6_9PLAT|nr:unnamed protein product [Protopolystoma xenopodis]